MVGSGVLAGGCREPTVELGLDVEVGDEQEYRYEIEIEVVHAVDDGESETVTLDTVVTAEQRIVAVDESGATAEVTLHTDGGTPRVTEVRLDPSGLLGGVNLIAGEDLDVFGLGSVARMLPPVPLPSDRVSVGTEWPARAETTSGTVRLDRLGIVDDQPVAVVTSDLVDEVEEVRPAADTTATVLGEVRSVTTVAFDLDDGTARRVRSTSTGDLTSAIMPPPGVDADPVSGTISYTVRVEAVRLS